MCARVLIRSPAGVPVSIAVTLGWTEPRTMAKEVEVAVVRKVVSFTATAKAPSLTKAVWTAPSVKVEWMWTVPTGYTAHVRPLADVGAAGVPRTSHWWWRRRWWQRRAAESGKRATWPERGRAVGWAVPRVISIVPGRLE